MAWVRGTATAMGRFREAEAQAYGLDFEGWEKGASGQRPALWKESWEVGRGQGCRRGRLSVAGVEAERPWGPASAEVALCLERSLGGVGCLAGVAWGPQIRRVRCLGQ